MIPTTKLLKIYVPVPAKVRMKKSIRNCVVLRKYSGFWYSFNKNWRSFSCRISISSTCSLRNRAKENFATTKKLIKKIHTMPNPIGNRASILSITILSNYNQSKLSIFYIPILKAYPIYYANPF